MSITAREFMDTMENLINSPNQRLIGNLTGGYVYAVDEDGYKPELMYAATEISKANRKAAEAQNQLDAIKYAINDVYQDRCKSGKRRFRSRKGTGNGDCKESLRKYGELLQPVQKAHTAVSYAAFERHPQVTRSGKNGKRDF